MSSIVSELSSPDCLSTSKTSSFVNLRFGSLNFSKIIFLICSGICWFWVANLIETRGFLFYLVRRCGVLEFIRQVGIQPGFQDLKREECAFNPSRTEVVQAEVFKNVFLGEFLYVLEIFSHYQFRQHRGTCLAYRASLSRELDIDHLVVLYVEVHLKLVSAERIAVPLCHVGIWQLAVISRVPVVIQYYFPVYVRATQILNSSFAL